MRVVVPYTHQSPEVWAALPDDAEWHDVSADPHAYWRLLRDVWADGEAFMVVEHDVIIHDEVIPQFEECPEPWCLFGYADMCHDECREAWANMLGCTRFSRDIIEACPDAVLTIPEHGRDWHNLCDHIAGDKIDGTPAPLRAHSLRHAGFTHHWHEPHVGHHPWGIPENDRRLGRV